MNTTNQDKCLLFLFFFFPEKLSLLNIFYIHMRKLKAHFPCQSSTWKIVAQVEIPASGSAIVEELLENRTPGPGNVLLVFVPVVNAKIPFSV